MVKENMKQTEIGLIPEDWTASRLGDVLLNYRLGGNYPTLDMPNQSPLIKMGNVGRGKINISKLEYIVGEPNVSDLLRYGDLLLNTRNTLELVGKVSIWRNELREAYYNSNLLKLNFNSKFVSSNFYINAVFNDERIIQQLLNIATGTTSVAAIYTRDLLDIQIPLPPLAEQEAIAAALSDCDAWIETLEAVIAKKRLIKQGAMQELLTPKEDWEMKKLGDLIKFQTGFPFSSEFFNTDYRGARLIKNRDLRSDDSIFYYSGTYSKDFIVNNGDLLIGMDGDFEPVLWKKGFALLNQRVGRVLILQEVSLIFLSFILIRHLKEIENSTGSTTVKHLAHSDVENIFAEIPSFPEQTRIATVLFDIDAELEALGQKLNKARQIKQGMMQELLTGRVRLIV